MIDENGGYILWVRRGLGQYAGWVNAFNSIASNVCDLPTYPVLFCSYVEAFLGLIVFSAFSFIVNDPFLNRDSNNCSTLIHSWSFVRYTHSSCDPTIKHAPFVLEPLSIETFNLATWGSVAPQIDWSLFLSTILWNYQGWDSLGCVAGEVKDGGRTYPIAITTSTNVSKRARSAASAECFWYCLYSANPATAATQPVPMAIAVSQWHEGSLETIAMTVAPWLGIWVGMAAVVATLGEFNVVMACSSRALWATAHYKMLPSCLAMEWKRFGTPIAAVIFQTMTTGVLMNFSLELLVGLDTFFNKYV
ncbi:Amino Acid-Polyamine-Organocation (APC) Family, partial [Phytophthora palmivora]